jgi:hypothetical protein
MSLVNLHSSLGCVGPFITEVWQPQSDFTRKSLVPPFAITHESRMERVRVEANAAWRELPTES